MIETPIEVHPSNGEVADWKDNSPFTFKFKGDKVSYIYGEMFNLATNKRRVGWTCLHNTNSSKGYNNEIIENHPLHFFDETDYNIDYKYRYIICQQNIGTVNLERKKDSKNKDTEIGLYKIENIPQAGETIYADVQNPNWELFEDNAIFRPEVQGINITGFYLPSMPSKIFNCLAEFVDGYEQHKLNGNSKTVTQPYFYFVVELFYSDKNSRILQFDKLDYHNKYIGLKTNISTADYIQPKAVALYVSPNAPDPSIYIGRTSMASMPMGSNAHYFILDNGMINYLKDGDKHIVDSPIMGTESGVISAGQEYYTTVRNMYVKIEDEIRRIVDYQVVYNSDTNNTQYYLMYNFPLPTNPSVNTPVEIYTNYIKTPWYDFKCRHTPTAELTVARNPDTGFLKCTSSYSQLDGISLKSYNFSVFNNSRSKCVATTNNQYSYRQEWEFPLPTITGNYTVDALLTSQDNDTVGISKKISSGKYFLKNISTIETNDEDHSIRVDWSENDFTSGLGDVGEYYNVYRKIDDGKKNIKASDDFVFIGTTQSLGITDYTAGNNQSYCYQVENSGENNIHTLLDLTFAEQSFNSEPQTNTPFASENYSYTSSISSTTGVYSNPFVMPNGKYHINVISQSKPSNMELVIYNPYYGCYGYGDNGYVDLDWEKIDDNYYVCDFEIKTDYQQNYVMLGDPSKNMGRWSALDIQLYQITPYTYLYTDPITTNWDGWSISALTQIKDFHGLHQYEIGDTWRFYAELNEPTITMQNDFQVHNGTAQYGQISRGNNNYDSGTFTSNIIEMECPDKIIYDDIDKIQKWKKFIYDNEAFLLKSSKGDVWIVGITDSPTRQYEQGMNEPTIVSYNWVEIDDVRKAIIVD